MKMTHRQTDTAIRTIRLRARYLIAGGVGLVVIAAVLYILWPNPSVLDTSTIRQVRFPVYAPKLAPEGYSLKKDSMVVTDSTVTYSFVILHESDKDTTGIGFGVTAPTSRTMNNWCVNTVSTLLSSSPGHWGSYCDVGDATTTTSGIDSPGTIFTSTMEGYIQTDNEGGVLQLRMKSENDNEEVVVKSGSFGILQIVQ